MEQRIEAIGLVCPQPVILAKKAVDAGITGDVILVTVDNEIAVENLRKLANSGGTGYASKKLGEKKYEVRLTVLKEGSRAGQEEKKEDYPKAAKDVSAVVVLSSDKMGEGDEVLGKLLLKGFVYALTQLSSLPQTVLLYNGGARLSCEGSESLEDLKILEAAGTEILTCGTCLNHYGLSDSLAVGIATNMYEIVQRQTEAGKIIRP